ncbi:MAG TPA: hypothetical protein VKL40_09945 [Candidatus Angelobacter sp.]|nr:hypothetical protein [Candidatus Angelobacter sp.]
MRSNLTQFIVGGALALLLAALVPGPAYGQDSSQNDPNKSASQTQPKTAGTDTSQGPAPANNPANTAYSVSLADGQAIPLNQNATQEAGRGAQVPAGQKARTQLLFGATASAVYVDDYAPASIENQTAGVFSPYLGIYVPTRTGGMTLQYLGVYTPDSVLTDEPEAFHSLAFNAAGAFTRRTYWTLSSTAGYGSEAARFEGPLTYLAIGMVPVVNPVATGALLQGRNLASLQTIGKLGWRTTQRDRFELTAYHTFTELTSAGPALSGDRSNAVGGKLDYAHDVNSRVTFHLYGQDEHILESNCNTYGGGVGVSARLSYSWYLDASAGPQWTSANCGSQQYANFYGALTKTLRGNARAYIVGWRYFSTAFQTTSHWTDAVAVGFVQPIRRFSVQADGGYFKGNPVLVANEPIQGYYVAPLVRYLLTEHTSVSAGYRIFHATGGNTVPGSLHYAAVSLEWRPAPVRLK